MRITATLLTVGTICSCSAPPEAAAPPEHRRPAAPGAFVARGAIPVHAAEGMFKEPGGVHFDPATRLLYVADTKSRVVRVFDEWGVPVSVIGERVGLVDPRVVHANAAGEVFVLDSDQSVIKAFDRNGNVAEPLVFSAAADGPPIERIGTFTLDREGAWYVADADRARVVVYESDRTVRHVLPREGERGSFGVVTGLAVSDDGLLAVLDWEAEPVQVFDGAGRFVSGFGERDLSIADFTAPMAAAFDEEGRLYVVDMLRHDVKVFDLRGDYQTRFGDRFEESKFGREPGELLYPTGIAITPEGGRIYVSERFGNRVQFFERIAASD